MSRLHGLEVLVVHAKPRLSPWSRLLLVERVAAGRPAAHVAAEMGISRATAYKWLARYRAEGSIGLLDRSSRPRTCPTRTGGRGGDRGVAPEPAPRAGPDCRDLAAEPAHGATGAGP